MIYFIAAAGAGAVALLLTEPARIEASAQTPKDSSFAERFTLSRNVIVKVVGDSTKHLNIFDGSKVKARKLDSADRGTLSSNDVVVLKSPSGNGNNPYRLRQIDRIEDGRAYFKNPPCSEFPALKDRKVEAIFAKVTHIEKAKAA